MDPALPLLAILAYPYFDLALEKKHAICVGGFISMIFFFQTDI